MISDMLRTILDKTKKSGVQGLEPVWLCGLAVLLLVVLTLMRFDLLSVWANETLSPTDIIHDGGYSYRVAYRGPSYSDKDHHPSPLEIYQDGTLLDKPHAAHHDIRTLGEGRYSHWGETLFFSARDNSEPRSKQRAYQVRYPWRPSDLMLSGVALIALLLSALWLREAGFSLRRSVGYIVQRLSSAAATVNNSRWWENVWLGLLSTLLLALLIVMRLGLMPVWISETMPSSSIVHDGGYSYRVAFNRSHYFDTGERQASLLEIYQDGRPLSKPHASHHLIQTSGEGRFSHWENEIFFSASDNSDPRVNQRDYRLRYPWRPTGTVLFGVALIALMLNGHRLRDAVAKFDTCRPSWLIVTLCFIALVYRVFVAIDLWHGTIEGFQIKGVPFSDAMNWYQRGMNLAYGHIVHPETAVWDARRPGYSWFLGVVIKLFGDGQQLIRIIQIGLSALSTGLLFDLLRRITVRSVALLATTVHLFMVWDATSNVAIMSESLGYFLSNLALWWLVVTVVTPARFNSTLFNLAVAAALLVAANMVRPLNLLALPGLALMSGWLVARFGPSINWRRWLLAVAVMGLGGALVLAPWLVRQKMAYDLVALSDNSIEMLYAATSPTIQSWHSGVLREVMVDHPKVANDISLRYQYFQHRVAEQLADHLGWYLEQVIRRSWYHAVAIAPPGWLVALTAILFMIAHSGPSKKYARSRRFFFGGTVVVAALLLPVTIFSVSVTIGWLITVVWAVVRSQPIALLGLLLIPTLLALGALSVAVSMRFDYSLLWLAAAVTLHGVWYGLAHVSAVTTEVPSIAGNNDQVSQTWQRVIGVALLAITLGGTATLLTAHYFPQIVKTVVPDKARIHIVVDQFITRPENALFVPFKDRLQVYQTTLKKGFAMLVDRSDNFYGISPMFTPRSYPYIAQYTFPSINHNYLNVDPDSKPSVWANPCHDAIFILPGEAASRRLIPSQRYDFIGVCRIVKGAGRKVFEVLEVYPVSSDGSGLLRNDEITRQHRQAIQSMLIQE